MDKLIKLYIEDMKLAWSPTTLRSERYRLQGVVDALKSHDPNLLWQTLEQKGIAPYARVTTWTRVCRFYDWLLERGHVKGINVYDAFRRKNARLFKNAYIRRTPDISYEEATRRIGQITDAGAQQFARELLASGMRYSEHGRLENGTVVGKGGKRRRVYLPSMQGPKYTRSYMSFLRALARVGLKPHDLRKLCLQRLVDLGANEFELCAAAGWSSLNTASSYIKANDDKLKQLFTEVQKGERKAK